MNEINSLFQYLEQFKLAPIDKWNPQVEKEIDIRIANDGQWFYQGSAMTRYKITKLFATVLAKEEEKFFLITPHVKYQIAVDEVPFMAVELRFSSVNNRIIYLRTNMDEVVQVGQDNPLWVEMNLITNEPAPYVHVRQGLNAKLTRAVYLELAESLQEAVDFSTSHEMGVMSDGVFFSLGNLYN